MNDVTIDVHFFPAGEPHDRSTLFHFSLDAFRSLARPLARSPNKTTTDDVGASFPVLRGGEDESRSAGADEVERPPVGPSRFGAASGRGAGPPQPPAAENHPLHAPKGSLEP